MLALTYCLLTAGAFAAASPQPPQVSIRDGIVVGAADDRVDTFTGIPFAQPPVGNLRLRPPQTLAAPFGTLNATGTPVACPALTIQADNFTFGQVPPEDLQPLLSLFPPVTSFREDCLTLNVQRPSSANATSNLPVLFWIYGGGFERGSTQDNDFTYFVNRSIDLQHPVIVVQANYRVASFGFLGGKQLQAEGSTNLGLRDQRFALEWVADNIAAFGGDPRRVTIYGESAGSISVFDQTLVNGGNNTYHGQELFRAAIMNSGSSFPRDPVDSDAPQAEYDMVVDAAGCASAIDSLSCLRALPYEDFYNATQVVPSLVNIHGVSLSFSPRADPSSDFFSESPELALLAVPPRVAKVPVIAGTQMDEGTFFALALYNDTTADLLVDFLQGLHPNTSRTTLQGFVDLYPSGDPAAGSPYGTGPDNELYPGFKRNAAVLGDLIFAFQRRAYFSTITDTIPAWGFLASYVRVQYLGTSHGSDIALFHSGTPAVPYNDILQHYISFINYMDPNAIGAGNGGSCLPKWQPWAVEDKHLMEFRDDGEGLIADDFREAAYNFFRNSWSQWRL